MSGPQRRIDDHVHLEYWSKIDQHRYEDKIADELKGLRDDVNGLGNRLTLILGALALLAFVLPLAAPFIRQALGFPGP